DGDPDITGFDPGLEGLCGGARTQGAQGQVGVQGGRTRLAELLIHECPVERVTHQGLAARRGAEYPSGWPRILSDSSCGMVSGICTSSSRAKRSDTDDSSADSGRSSASQIADSSSEEASFCPRSISLR